MKYLGILLLALMLLGAGGAGGYFYFQQTAVASYGAENLDARAAKEAEKQAAKKASAEAKNLRFVEMDPIILPIIDSTGVTQVVTLVISLEVIGEDNAEHATLMAPRLKDAYIQDMYGVLNRKASMEGGVIKVEELKERLNKISSKVLGDNKINDVLLQVVNQRPI
jgi:flagellar FliL protein